MELNVKGIVRRFVKTVSDQRDLRLTNAESLAVAMTELDLQELARAGRLWSGGNQIIANGIAPVAAIPTTTATLALYNGEDAGGQSLLVRDLGYWLGSGTAAAGATLFACVSPSKIATAPAMATGYGKASNSGSSRGSKAVFGTAVTLPGTPAWKRVQSTQQAAAANVGQGDGNPVDLRGSFLVPPGYALGLAILSGAGTTPLYGISVEWAEIEQDLE